MVLDVVFEEHDQVLKVDFEDDNKMMFEVDIDAFYSKDKPFYLGEYEVTPTTSTQVLPTKDTVMIDNVTIKKVPYYETENEFGGSTVYIASEVK